MLAILKLGCIGIFVLGIASALGFLPDSWAILSTIAALVLAAHLIEVLVMFKYVRRYRGTLAVSVLLTLLFGLAHWKPIADRARK